MRRTSVLAAVLAAALAAAAPTPAAPAAAQEKPKPAAPAADPVAADVAALRALVKAQQWQKGADLARAILKKYPGDTRVLARIEDVETDLRTCLWRLVRKPVPLEDVFGRGAVRVNTGRQAEFAFPRGIAGEDGWEAAGEVQVFDVPFEEATVTYEVTGCVSLSGGTYEAVPPPAVILHYDTERNGGYVFVTKVVSLSGYGDASLEGHIARWGEREQHLTRKPAAAWIDAKSRVRVEASERSGALSLRLCDREAAKATDSVHKDGMVAVVGHPAAMARIRDFRIVGRISDRYFRRVRNEFEEAREREWLAGWRREDHVPAWVMQAEDEAAWRRCLLPSDATDSYRKWFRENWESLLDADPDRVAAFAAWAAKAPEITALYTQAVVLFANGSHVGADLNLRRVTDLEPGFGPAWALLALNSLALGDDARTTALLADAKDRAEFHPWTWEAAALVAIGAGDLNGAQAAIDAAATHRAGSPGLRDVARSVSRLRNGPGWAATHRSESANYIVQSDHSVAVCTEVAAMLEEARTAFRTQFRPEPKGTRPKAKVWVFSGFDSYADYGAESGSDLEGTLGVYRPALRELLVFLHEDRRELRNTVRHEGFHQYLHLFLPDAPIWFNEGNAEWFGFARRQGGRSVGGQVDAMQAAEVAAYRKSFVPLDRLFRMKPREFMSKPGPRYAQSWAVIHMLRQSKDPRWKGLLDRYTDALLAGKGADGAYDEVMKPVLAVLEATLLAHVAQIVATK